MISRRGFMAGTGSVVAGAMAAEALNAIGESDAARGSLFVKSDDPAVLAKAHRDLGYRAPMPRATFP